ncbi:MAG: molybdopterin molybdotransferase MoeA [Planctomycetes bacterium]|nr:molybdopterin molybdotransferase MoeA [Planctomycetota bacterium]
MITPRDAVRLVLKHTRPLGATRLGLAQALGHCLAEDVRADRDLPPADRSAMDGYAVRFADLARIPCDLRLKGEVAAGSAARPRVTAGSCVRILTGGNVPPGADTVIVVEQTEARNGHVTVQGRPAQGANILRRGEDARRGTVLLRKGTVLGPLQIGTCAAVGKARVLVRRRPSVAVLCTGEELRAPEASVRAHEIRNSNGPMLFAALAAWGYPGAPCATAPDDVALLTDALRDHLARHDVVLLTGGVSVGNYDFVREAVERIGATVRFHGVAMKPGKPCLYATTREGRHVFGLPGNPLSAMNGFHEFALVALRRLSGLSPSKCQSGLRVVLASRLTSPGGRARYLLARLAWNGEGPIATPIATRSSADLVAGGSADGVLVVPGDTREMPTGSAAEFRPWRPWR